MGSAAHIRDAMSDDDRVTISELDRTLERLFGILREDIANLRAELASKVDADIHRETVRRVEALEVARQRDAERSQADRRTLFASLIAPLIVTMVIGIGGLALSLYGLLSGGTPP
jgi:hypothetical protein